MLRKFLFGASASLAALVALPGAAQADHRDGYYSDRGYDRHYGDDYRRYRRGDYYGGARARGYDRGYDRRYYGRNEYYRGRRCGSGTTGAIVGGAAGALIGREVARDGRRYRYRRGNDGTVGAIVGGVVGALVGREIDRSC